MAVVTTAIAVGAAAALSAGAVAAGVATVATVATIGAVVAAAGVAMTVVGMVTENKDLLKVGEIMTGVGAGAGLGALAAGALGLGSAAASTAGAAGSTAAATGASTAEAAAPAASGAVINPSVSASVTQSMAQAGKVGAGSVLAPAAAQTGVGAGTVVAPTASSAGSSVLPLATQGGQTAAKLMASAPAAPTAPAPVAPTAPSAPTAPMTPMVSNTGVSVAGATPSGGFWNSLDPSMKAMLMMGGTQMVGQGAAGMFAGASQSEQNDLLARRIGIEQQVADQQEAQREFLREGGRYAPAVSFNRPKGMIWRNFPHNA